MICWCAFARMVFRVDSTDLVSAVLCPGLLQGFRARRLSLQRQRCAHLRFFANPGSAGILPAFSLLKHAAKMAALPGIVKARKTSDAHDAELNRGLTFCRSSLTCGSMLSDTAKPPGILGTRLLIFLLASSSFACLIG